MNLCLSAKSLMTISLGINPIRGGSPPRENRAKKHNILIGGWGIVDSCLKWKVWLKLSVMISDSDTRE